jgi:plastocyanin
VRERRKLTVVGVVLALLVGACGGGDGGGSASGGGDGERRRVLVDYKHDQFAASFLSYFPKRVKVHAGDTVEFRQYWSGEPHTVTMGTAIDELGKGFWEILDPLFAGEDVDVPEEEPAGAEEFFEKIPFLADEETLEPIQAAAQPCYLDEGTPDFSDIDVPCENQEQPAFNGRQSYYNSGFIPFQGAQGNSFELPLSDDIEPGTYHYYCNWHFVGMSGVVEVVPDDEELPSQEEINRAAREEVDVDAAVLQQALDAIQRGPSTSEPLVGVPLPDEVEEERPLFHAFVDEFVPSTVEAKVGKKVTWTFSGGHNIAFNVPKYFPVFEVKKDGRVTIDKRAFEAVKWPAPERPESEGEGEEAPPEPIHVDGGRFDGDGGFHSTGLDYNDGDTFSLTFTKTGTYLFACLIHPAMVGKVVVK